VPLAEDTLQHLLDRGERARVSGSQRVVRESFKDADSAYWAQGLDERDRMHGVLTRAESAGAVELKWSRQGGDDRPLEFVVLGDLDRLASFLRVPTASSSVQRAADVLAPWMLGYPRISELLDTWSRLKRVRTLGPDAAGDFVDALRVVEAMAKTAEDRLARPLSVELFGQSKRIEALYTHLDVLSAEAINAPARHWSEVLGALGIRKEPQPFLVAGAGRLELIRGPAVPIAQPFVGIANHALAGYVGRPAWVLSIENLTTFHQCAELLAGASHGLVLFTGGMPSPSWTRAYARVLQGAPEGARVLHWGDHDEGGFRIAARIAGICAQANRRLLPWHMQVAEGREASEPQRHAMSVNARRAGWDALAEHMPPLLLEQESQPPALPPS